MALRWFFGFSDGELMRSDAKPCSRLMRQTAGIFSVGGALGFWVLCRLHYGPRITIPRSLRWAAIGAITTSSTTENEFCIMYNILKTKIATELWYDFGGVVLFVYASENLINVSGEYL
ncbi:hypothetical protein ACH5RR_022766 [Cinchona calisaya]|uniref:DUF7875 domain-containing protein n=1 Tax=Cinchona calisaya TaxID=153742 RepID=A0ABD2Z8S5_9GENT